MPKFFRVIALSGILVLIGKGAFSGQFVVELSEPLHSPPSDLMQRHGVVLNDLLASGAESYAIFTATDQNSLEAFLTASSVDAEKVSEVLFVNSPTLGGGTASGASPKPGHDVFVIERPIPGVGFFGLEKKRQISQSSVAAIERLGAIIEWDKSYLTSEGTYCLYRADSSATLREHGALAGAPIGKITQVRQITYAEK